MRIAILLTILITLPTMSQNIDDPSTTMWYTRPATSWQHEALPIGNGRIGAMIFGGVGYERIALNDTCDVQGPFKFSN